MALDPIVTFPQRQYVGARYVPIYKGAWDPQTSYEPLSIVVKDGNSWTSKIFVPAGIELSNEAYWFQSGNVNGQTIELQKQITELEKSVENSIDNINNEIENVNNRLDNLIIKRNIIFITDSYGVSSSEGTPFTTAAKPCWLMIKQLRTSPLVPRGVLDLLSRDPLAGQLSPRISQQE